MANEIMMKLLFSQKVFAAVDYARTVMFQGIDERPVDFPKLVFLLKDDDGRGVKKSELELLKKISDYIGIDPGEVAALNNAFENISFRSLLSSRVNGIISFGLQPGNIGLQIETKPNQVVRFMDVQLLFTMPLQKLVALPKEDSFKTQFFNNVRKIFTAS